MIRKTSETRALAGNIVNAYNDSQNSAYSTEYINGMINYSTDETFTGKYWIDSKPIYRKVFDITTDVASIPANSQVTLSSISTSVVSTIDKIISANIIRTGTNDLVYMGISYIQKVDTNNTINLTSITALTVSSGNTMYLTLEYTKSS